jgi:hypothetical protein
MTAIHWNPQTIGYAWSAQLFWQTSHSRQTVRSASRVVEVRAQEHCDYASFVKVQGAFDEARIDIGNLRVYAAARQAV